MAIFELLDSSACKEYSEKGVQASKIFDSSTLSEADMVCGAKEYLDLRKAAFEAAREVTGAGVDDMLQSLNNFALADDDIDD
jgi:hypothetical protein